MPITQPLQPQRESDGYYKAFIHPKSRAKLTPKLVPIKKLLPVWWAKGFFGRFTLEAQPVRELGYDLVLGYDNPGPDLQHD